MTDDRQAPRQPIDLARDELARIIEAEYPGITVEHSMAGWIARRDGQEIARGQSHVALKALLPFTDD